MIKRPKRVARVHIKMTPEMKLQCEQAAYREGLTLTAWLEAAAKQRLAQSESSR